MRVGFDYYHTITTHPEKLAELSRTLISGGNEVVIISAIGSKPTNEETIKKVEKYRARLREHLEEINFSYTNIHVVAVTSHKDTPKDKTKLALKVGLDLYFDDRADVCHEMNLNGIASFLVVQDS